MKRSLRMCALCHRPWSSPALHDVKPHLHHAGLTCHQRSFRRPARRSRRSTRANSRQRSAFSLQWSRHKDQPVWRWPSVTPLHYGLQTFELCVWSDFSGKEMIICAVSEFIPPNTFGFKPQCLQHRSCLPTCAWLKCRETKCREREREKKVLSRCLLWFMCIHYNTITVEVTQDMRDVLSTNT